MHLVAIGWIYVVLVMALAEAFSPDGTVIGAIFTFVLYGLLPLALVLYLLGTPARRRSRRAAESAAAAARETSGSPPDGRGHPPGDAVAPEREEP